MTIPSSLTLNYDAVLSTTLFNAREKLEDEVSTSNVLLFKIMKMGDTYKKVASLGDRVEVPLMYELASADSYSGYDPLDVTPMDGISAAFFDWSQSAVPIAISELERKKNTGEHQLVNLLQSKIKQGLLGIQEFMGKCILQGQGKVDTTSITSAYTSPSNGSTMFDPLAKLVPLDPTASVVIGNINQNTYTWWRNQFKDSAATTWAMLEKELRNLYNNCSKGPGGFPDLHIVDQDTFEMYEAMLASRHQNPSFKEADIPFTNIRFKGGTLTWDEFVPDVKTGSTTITKGTWWMLNTKFWGLTVHKGTNFVNTPFQKPVNQDAKVSHILWLGTMWVSNRRKQGVIGDILLTMTS